MQYLTPSILKKDGKKKQFPKVQLLQIETDRQTDRENTFYPVASSFPILTSRKEQKQTER